MRKYYLIPAVLILFLLVPASITWAQIVSITGVVYENQTAKIPFKVPEGSINIYLPDDMAAGDVISGTIILEPTGRTDKQKQKNLDVLKKYSLAIGSKPGSADLFDSRSKELVFAAIDNGARFGFNSTYDVCLSLNCTSYIDLQLENRSVSRAEVPVIKINSPTTEKKPPPKPTLDISWDLAEYEMLKKVISYNENIVLGYRPGMSDPAWFLPSLDTWHINDKKVNVLCSSPRQLILNVPAGTIGKTIITAKDNNGKTVFTDDVFVVDIKASIDKTNLRRGERTNLHVSVDGMDECPYPVSVSIINKTSGIILLDKGTLQTYNINPAFNPKEYSAGKNVPFNLHQGVTGVVPGNYDITASLILPSIAFGDIFHQQKSALKTPEDYNAWVDALKKDLKAYADRQGNDEVGKAAKANAQRAMENIQKCHDKNKLDECKAFADAFLRPVSIPAAAATLWVCGFEAYKAAIKAITGTLAGKPELIDWEVIKNGLEFIRNMGEKLNDEALQNGAADARKIVDDIKKAGETKENLEKLNEKLRELTPKLNNKISTDPSPFYAYTMQDLLISSHLSHIPVYRPPDGSLISLNIGNNSSTGLYSVSNIVQRSYEMNISPGISPVFHDWINSFFNNKSSLQDLNIIIPSSNGRKSKRIDFVNAMISEFTLPEMDANDKEQPMMIAVRLSPENVKYTATDAKPKTITQQQGKQWMPCNFKIELGDLPCNRVTKIESIKFTTKTTEDKKIPARLCIPDITFIVPGSDFDKYQKWHENFIINGKNDAAGFKEGKIEYINPDGSSLFSIPLKKVIPVMMRSNNDGNYSITVQPGSPENLYDTKPGEQLFKPGDKVESLEDSLKRRKDELEQKKRERDILIDEEIKKKGKEKRDCEEKLKEAEKKAKAANDAFEKAKKKKENIEKNIGPGKTFPDKEAAKKHFGDYEKEYNDAKAAMDLAHINLGGLKTKCPELTKALDALKKRKTEALPTEIEKDEKDIKELEEELDRERTKAEEEKKRIEDEQKKKEEEQRQKTEAEKNAEDAKYKTKAENIYLLQNIYSLGLISSKLWETPGLMDWLPDALEKPVGDAAEELIKTPIPLDAINAIAGLYGVVGAKLDPCTAEGSITTIKRLRSMINSKTKQLYTENEALDKTERMCDVLKKIKAIAAAAKGK